MPNPWDLGSARVLAQLGFPALATTSAGFAWSVGVADHGISVVEKLDHLRAMSDGVDVPLNADFEGGFAVAPDEVAINVAAAVTTGIAGISIEDASHDPSKPLFDFDLAVDRMRSARRAIDDSGRAVLLTGRSEGYLVGRADLAETIRRLSAYSEAGAECLYAPGLRTLSDIKAVVNAVAPTPVNVLVASDFVTVADLAEAGVRRISVGGALARLALTGVLNAAKEMLERGTFKELSRAASHADINGSFLRMRQPSKP